MTLEEFLNLVQPDDGYKYIQYGTKPGPYRSARTSPGLAETIEDHKDTNVWFAPASFIQREYIDHDGKTKRRTQENTLCAKAHWLDIDVGQAKAAAGKGYASTEEARLAITAFCTTYGLPEPLKVSSGNGIHCYWVYEKAISRTAWERVAELLHTLVKRQGLLADASRTRDIASLLRPIGTTNYKNPDYPKSVELLATHAGCLDATAFAKCLLAHTSGAPTLPAAPKHLKAAINDDLAMPAGAYPDVDAEQLANACAQIRFFRDTGSDDYAHWWNAIGIVKHAVDGESFCHAWSANYAGYSQSETQFKIDEWKTGPATCKAFDDYRGLCAGCRHFGKIPSPVRLGFKTETEVEVPADAVTFAESEDETPATRTIELPWPYSLDSNRRLCVTLRKPIKPPKDAPPGTPVEYDEELVKWCDVFFYPVDRIEAEDGIMQQRMRVEIRGRVKDFTIPARLIGPGGRELHSILSQYEIVVSPKYKPILDEYMVAFTNKLREARDSVLSHKTFGWQPDGGFIMGDRCYTADGVRPVVLGGENAPSLAKHLAAKGNAQRWAELVAAAYDHPDHEPYQYVIYTGFGSVLMKLMNACSVLSLCGEKGTGKTTVANVALGIYGNPEGWAQSYKTGTTFNAMVETCATLGAIPHLVDEFTNAEGISFSDTAYTLANGKPKARLSGDGKLRKTAPWNNTSIITTNSSLHEKLWFTKDDASAEISRILEIDWRHVKSALHMNEYMRIYDELGNHWGAAGDVYIRYLAQHKDKVYKLMMTLKEQLDTEIGFGSESRFWSFSLAAALTGGVVATKLGLVQFDWKGVRDFAVDLGAGHLQRIGGVVHSPLESFNNMLTYNASRLITTSQEADTRFGALLDVPNIHEPVGRVISSQGIAYISTVAVKDWCKLRHIGYENMRHALMTSGILLDSTVRYYLGRGTKLSTGQAICWKIDWSKISNQAPATTGHLQLVKP